MDVQPVMTGITRVHLCVDETAREQVDSVRFTLSNHQFAIFPLHSVGGVTLAFGPQRPLHYPFTLEARLDGQSILMQNVDKLEPDDCDPLLSIECVYQQNQLSLTPGDPTLAVFEPPLHIGVNAEAR